MKRTPYKVKAQRARKAWRRLKEQKLSKPNHQTEMIGTTTLDHKIIEMAYDV